MDRKKIVTKHNPIVTKVDPVAPLSIGNGEFGFSLDVTGLQTFPEAYESPLGTQSNWGWHYTHGKDVYSDNDIVYQKFDTYGRTVGYPMKPEGKDEAYHWLRQNPHRLQLGRVSFQFLTKDGREVKVDELTKIEQRLDLWKGIIDSRFVVDGVGVRVKTACHPNQDSIAVSVWSPLISENRLRVFQLFPSPDITHDSWSKAIHPNWNQDARHETDIVNKSSQHVLLKRVMDEDCYYVRWDWTAGQLVQTKKHQFTLQPSDDSKELHFTVSYKPDAPSQVEVTEVFNASELHWQSFWEGGAFVSFEGSTDERAFELERRVILSQYLTAIHSGGSIPPQETGFMYNSWFGKHHLEMHWWHAAHFPLWGRAELLEKSMGWYLDILPLAQELADSQGYAGARWPKMVGFDGKQSPSPVAPGLIWQQPHPVALAELLYQANSTRQTLQNYQTIVFDSADFMVDFAHWDEASKSFVLGSPLIPAQECHDMTESKNPPYELEYWKYALEIAIEWANRLGVSANPIWKKVASHLAKPTHLDGVYLAHENCHNTFTEKNHDHPSMLAAYGVLSGTLIDPTIMKNTLEKVKHEWQWETAWGWDFPVCAMTATRLGEPELAVDFLMMEATKNTYLVNGHNYQRPGLTAYLPGNGGLLTAIAMMISGWAVGNVASTRITAQSQGYENEARSSGQANPCPGFPKDGTWSVQAEGLQPWL
ncbi:glycoside hydrolase family 65 [Aquibacillus rhizosphaerae]|uniref:Glycoside hydrolase family 65 n=1 Tax=Aquibacillus rhizosphaerae TaxID=3051431 RepID=A0ABT7L9T3_9BACI|nr:glycoside hydrolase family 65 [Aquibacillus sp. LR5S19]MDL4842612.1 glycoside hydrolase family 65 [Aquibacillus sp. LR5S19]